MKLIARSQSIMVIASSGGHLTQAICATSLIDLDLILVNFFYACRLFIKEKPLAMFSTGGPICLPFALLARLTGTKFVFLDTMSRVTELSNSGKLIKKFGLYDSFLCQWPSVARQYSGAEYHGQAFDLGDHGHQ